MLTTFEFPIHDFMCYLCILIGTGNIILNVPPELGKWYLPNYAHLCQNELTEYAWSRYKFKSSKVIIMIKKEIFVNQCEVDTVISVIQAKNLHLQIVSCSRSIYFHFKSPPRSSKTVSAHCQRLC